MATILFLPTAVICLYPLLLSTFGTVSLITLLLLVMATLVAYMRHRVLPIGVRGEAHGELLRDLEHEPVAVDAMLLEEVA